MTDQAKTSAHQIDEIRKLVQDAQEKLDQVTRALRTLEERLERGERDRPRES